MRYLFGLMCVCALGVSPLVGCSEPTDDGGAGGTGGVGGTEGAGGVVGTGGTGGISGPCSLEGVTCSCTGDNPDAPCNRVHLNNLDNRAGIMVVLRAGEQVCTINELIVNAAGDIELDQCLMNIGIGDEVEISPLVAASVGNAATCSVNNDAAVPGLAGELQTFASVFDQPVSVACEQGFTMQSGP